MAEPRLGARRALPFWGLIALAAALLGEPASGVGDSLTAARPTGNRTVVEARDYPWSAIGKVNVAVSQRGHCTGALIGERLVVTAAHCLFFRATGRWVPPQYVHFVAGWQRDEYVAHSRAARYKVAPGFDGVRWSDPLNLPHDWALIVLEKPIGRETGYLGWRALAPDAETARMMEEEAFSLAGYPRDRAHAISLDAECRLVQFLRIKQDLPLLLGHRCAIIGGDSGAPIARRTQDGLEVVALNSAADLQLPTGERINSAVPLATFADEIAALLADTDPAGTGTPSAQGRAGRMPAR